MELDESVYVCVCVWGVVVCLYLTHKRLQLCCGFYQCVLKHELAW